MRRPTVALLVVAWIAACSAPASRSGTQPASAPAATNAETPSPAPDAELEGLLAYAAGVDHQIFLLDLATGDSRQLTELTADDAKLTSSGPMRPVISCGFGVSSLAWSPRGTQLAFTYGGCDSVVHIVDLDGVVTRVGDGRGPAWSPDGGSLVFSPNTPFCMGAAECGRPPHPGAWNLQVADIDAGAPPVPMMVDEATSEAGMPTWSPDGTLIAFSGPIPDGAANPGLFSATWIAQADGTDPRHLVNGAWPLGWLPDGRLLITQEQTGVVHAMNVETGDATAIGGGLTGQLEMSPDGTRYALGVSDPETSLMGIQLTTIDGDVLVQRSGTSGAWAPDGRAVAIVDTEVTGGIVILDRDGNEREAYPLPDPFSVHPIAWQPEPES
jgi:Tol biopolymer transport system component